MGFALTAYFSLSFDERRRTKDERRKACPEFTAGTNFKRRILSSFVTRHSSLVIRHSSFVIRHSSFVTRHSSLVIRHSSLVIHHSSFVIRLMLQKLIPIQRPQCLQKR